jgi:hypothetical protein
VGFMDKAKQMAEQAQQKIDDAQKQFNDNQAQRGQQSQGGGVRYDKHGRPITEDAPPAAQTPAAPVAPTQAPDAGAGQPVAPPAAETPAAPVAPEPAPVKDGVNATPDPFKPIE